MRYKIIRMAAIAAVGVATGDVLAFGRGAAVRGAAVGRGGAVRTAGAAHGVSSGPFGGTHAGTASGRTYSGPGGVSVQHGQARGATRGPLGGVSAGGASGTRVTGPGGQSYTHTQGGKASRGPLGGVAVGGGSRSAVRTPYGTGAATSQRSGVAVGPYGGVRAGSSSRSAVRTPFGGAAVGSRTGVATGPYGGARVGHTTSYMSPTSVRTTASVARQGYRGTAFTTNWYRGHTNAWVAPRWTTGASFWRPAAWATTAAFVGIAARPIVYDYGSTVVIHDDSVYVNGVAAGTPEEYAAQAAQLVDTGAQAAPAENDEWEPLGVFGLLQSADETTAQRIFQLAVNKDGIVRGNYYDAVSDTTIPVVGSVSPESQRVAWSIGDKKEIVFETGLSNLTQDQSTILVHYGTESTQQMIFVRLDESPAGP